MSNARAPVAHFEAMVWLLKELADSGIELYEHHFDPHAFGSFVLTLSRGHRRVRFAWDGRDATLSISFAHIESSSDSNVNWTHDANISLPNGEGLYEEIASESASMLA